MRATSFFILALALGTATICGCGGSTPQASTQQDRSTFKGGPMPPGYAEKMAQHIAEAQKENAEKAQKAKESAMSGQGQTPGK